MAGYETLRVEGKNYHVCAMCRRPHSPGYCAPRYIPDERYDYIVKEGKTIPADGNPKQSLCGECYTIEYEALYPDADLPYCPSNRLPGALPVAIGEKTAVVDQDALRKDRQREAARQVALVSGGQMDEEKAYMLLFGREASPEVEITGPA